MLALCCTALARCRKALLMGSGETARAAWNQLSRSLSFAAQAVALTSEPEERFVRKLSRAV